ncbi:MAG TPA: hypothetical protein PLP34_02010 [Chitinophagaceae bacterium]|nr:hypothetical protein [Chitinophagaceae bacterium]HNF71155.1 hypothetical protein [Chitinophagaceae bacterium]
MHHRLDKKFGTICNLLLAGSLLAFFFSFSSCRKDSFLKEGGDLSFSTDTLRFDTVFTSVGSVTRSFKIYNTNNQRIRLTEVRLKGGTASPYYMNVNGEPGKIIRDMDIQPNDSIYVFVAITINPTSGVNPFLVEDAVQVTLNGIQHEVPLEAYGQDAHYITDSLLSSQTWINDKPYVIVHSALVDTGETLTIQKGCRIYMHQDSKLYVAGTLLVFGTKSDSVIFQGDRLDRDYFGYKDYPGEWRGIDFLETSTSSRINYAIIKNGGLTDAALLMRPANTFDINNPNLDLKNTIIANSAGFGLVAFHSYVTATNCLIHTCGAQNIGVLEGGTYRFDFCTLATYGGTGINHSQQSTVALLNYRDTSLTGYIGNNLDAAFNNCLIYGPLDDELICGKKQEWNYNVSFTHCLLKRKTDLSPFAVLNNSIFNTDPEFKDYYKWDFHPLGTSPVKAAGFSIASVIDDLDGNPRPAIPSIGCYEAP